MFKKEFLKKNVLRNSQKVKMIGGIKIDFISLKLSLASLKSSLNSM